MRAWERDRKGGDEKGRKGQWGGKVREGDATGRYYGFFHPIPPEKVLSYVPAVRLATVGRLAFSDADTRVWNALLPTSLQHLLCSLSENV